jgi:hypothetical protein
MSLRDRIRRLMAETRLTVFQVNEISLEPLFTATEPACPIPVPGCQTCEPLPAPEQPYAIVAEALFLGRTPDEDEATRQVEMWLRHCAEEAGWLHSDVMRRWWAMKLIEVRDYVEAQGRGRG